MLGSCFVWYDIDAFERSVAHIVYNGGAFVAVYRIGVRLLPYPMGATMQRLQNFVQLVHDCRAVHTLPSDERPDP